MKYLLLLSTPADGLPEPGSPEVERLYAGYARAAKAMADAGGTVIECRPLHAASSATTVRVREQQTLLTDGPAAELREQVGGFALVDCADLDQAPWRAGRAAASSRRPGGDRAGTAAALGGRRRPGHAGNR